MIKTMRPSTLQTLGLGTVLDIFQKGRLPVNTADLVDQVFGPAPHRGALVISGANGIVGAGKSMQLGSRLQPFDIPIIALDFPRAGDSIGKQFPNLVRAFGKNSAHHIMSGIIRFNYDGKDLPPRLKDFHPRFLLEAIPEILEIKKSHYEIFRSAFPGIEIRSVTSGFPSSQLGVGITHPSFPHEINKVWEVVEPAPSPITHLLWSLGLIPIPVSDHWSFILDVLFCGITLAARRFHRASNMPFWRIDKYVRKLLGPNHFRAHDVIGAAGANFLTWSCLHHLSLHYGELFKPTPDLVERKDSGQNWFPPDHFRPLVNWPLVQEEEKEFETWILGPLFQMAGLLLQEERSHLSHMNAIGELCAQFRRGIFAEIRSRGSDSVNNIIDAYHKLHPEAAQSCRFPGVFESMDSPAWLQLYVNAEHDGNVGVITLGRESYSLDVDDELNRALDWLKNQGIDRVIITGDFHLSSQLVGADTGNFYPALKHVEIGEQISRKWSQTARRFHKEFKVSVGFINGKRCLGGMLELLLHCHFLVSIDNADLGMPEVTLPVVPGMEGCHWPFRKTAVEHWPKLLLLLLSGTFVKARDSVGWLVDFAGSLEESLAMAWKIASGSDHGLPVRKPVEDGLKEVPNAVPSLAGPVDPATEAARQAIFNTIRDSCRASLAQALDIQAKHSADFMRTEYCLNGKIGTDYSKTMAI